MAETSVRQLMAAALAQVAGAHEAVRLGEPLAEAFIDVMHQQGLALHRSKDCDAFRRLVQNPPGAPMTEEQRRLVGK